MEEQILNYRIIIEKEKYPNGSTVYVAYCPTLGISDYGDTIEKTLSSIKEGIELAIETLVKEKQNVPIDNLENQIITSTQINVPGNLNISFA